MNDEKRVIRAAIISKAMSGRYTNTRRMLRDLENVEDHYNTSEQSTKTQDQLLRLMGDNNAVVTTLAKKIEELEAKVAAK